MKVGGSVLHKLVCILKSILRQEPARNHILQNLSQTELVLGFCLVSLVPFLAYSFFTYVWLPVFHSVS